MKVRELIELLQKEDPSMWVKWYHVDPKEEILEKELLEVNMTRSFMQITLK